MHLQLSDLHHILNSINVMDRTLCTESNILCKKQDTIILFYFALVKPLLNYYVHQIERHAARIRRVQKNSTHNSTVFHGLNL